MPPRTERYIVPRPLQPYTLPLYRLVRRLKTALQTATCRVNPRPVLVLGNQKSGTTAIAALLGELTGLSTTLDLRRELTEPTFPRVRRGELTFDQFIRANKLDFSRRIVKEPNLTLFYSELKRRFPESPVAFVVRDPRDNLRSMLNRCQLPGDGTRSCAEDLAQVNQAWKVVIDNRWLGVEGERTVEQLAGRWCLMARIYLSHADEMILVRYEDFLRDKVDAITRLARELKLDPVADIRNLVDVQYQPRGDHDVSWEEFFGTDNLRRIERICGPVMRELGYAMSTGRRSGEA